MKPKTHGGGNTEINRTTHGPLQDVMRCISGNLLLAILHIKCQGNFNETIIYLTESHRIPLFFSQQYTSQAVASH